MSEFKVGDFVEVVVDKYPSAPKGSVGVVTFSQHQGCLVTNFIGMKEHDIREVEGYPQKAFHLFFRNEQIQLKEF